MKSPPPPPPPPPPPTHTREPHHVQLVRDGLDAAVRREEVRELREVPRQGVAVKDEFENPNFEKAVFHLLVLKGWNQALSSAMGLLDSTCTAPTRAAVVAAAAVELAGGAAAGDAGGLMFTNT
jgi:hypothetical protein